jgi:Carboxypeptidase regulatory-like domain
MRLLTAMGVVALLGLVTTPQPRAAAMPQPAFKRAVRLQWLNDSIWGHCEMAVELPVSGQGRAATDCRGEEGPLIHKESKLGIAETEGLRRASTPSRHWSNEPVKDDEAPDPDRACAAKAHSADGRPLKFSNADMRGPRRRGSMALGVLVGVVACASAPPKEPSGGRELWREQRCFAHMLPEWRHLEASALAGAVFTSGSSPAEWPIPIAVVFARRWPRGRVIRAQVDEKGQFAIPQLQNGTYEVAVCADGWNPWRGTVRLVNGPAPRTLAFPLDLGQ